MSRSTQDPQQQTCKICGCVDKFNYHVPDRLWNRIVPARHRNKVVCLACFDRLASRRGVDYSAFLDELYFVGERASLRFQAVSGADL